MEGRNVGWEDVSRKERELMEFEDDHRLEKRVFEHRYQELSNRSWELQRLVDQETDLMYLALNQFSISPDEVAPYFSEVEELLWQSDQTYRQEMFNLEMEEEEAEKSFRRKRDQLEEEYYQLRREYASTNQ